MDAAIQKLFENGIIAIVLGIVFLGIYRGAREVWATVKKWGTVMLEHWIASSKARDESVARVLTMIAEHELAAERRHAEALMRTAELAKEQRHTIRNLFTPMMLALDVKMSEIDDTPPDSHDGS